MACARTAAIATALLWLAGYSSAPRAVPEALVFAPCGDGAECAPLAVPVDYDKPDGPTWTIPVTRLPATTQPAELGVLLINVGGPGIGGTDIFKDAGDSWDALRAKYDLIGFDPRGTGGSVPTLDCLTDAQKEAIRGQSSAPRTPAEIAAARELGVLQGSACQSKFPDYLPFVGTANVARDMDAIRAALGQARISYFGFSYGTFLGALYADMFPGHTARVLLDSAMDPALDYVQVRHDQAIEQQAVFDRFVADCVAHPDCPVSSDNAQSAVGDLIAELDAHAFSDGNRTLSGSRATGLIESANYTPASLWKPLRKSLTDALNGNLSTMNVAAHSAALMVNPADSPYLAVVCIDFHTSRDIDRPERLAPQWQAEARLSGANRAWSLQPCETWPVPPDRRPAPITAAGSGPVLLTGNTYDPATPIAWGRSLAKQMAHATFLEVPASGHIAYEPGNGCAFAAMNAFLLAGTLPEVDACLRSGQGSQPASPALGGNAPGIPEQGP